MAITMAAFRAMGAVLTRAEPCFCTAIGVGAIGHTKAKNMAKAANNITALVPARNMA